MVWKHGMHVATWPRPGRGPQGMPTVAPSYQVDFTGGADSILAFICSRTTEEASQNVYKRILYSSRGTPLLFTAKQK